MATRYNYTGGIVTNGLVLNLDAAKTDSYPGTGTTWRDLSGNSNNGTLTNGPTFSGIGKQASIVFDGVDDYVDCGTGTLIPNSWTLTGWVNQRRITGTGMIVARSSDGPLYEQTGTLGWSSTRSSTFHVGGKLTNGAYYYECTSSVFLNTSSILNIVGTFNEPTTTLTLYINGAPVNTKNTGFSMTLTGSQRIQVGCSDGNTPGNFFSGSIYQTQIYNRSLSQFDVWQNFNAYKSRYGIPDIVTDGLVLNLDAGNPYSYLSGSSGTTWSNTVAVSSSISGTLTNGPVYSNGAITFDGTNDYVGYGNVLNFERTDSFSLSGWVRINSLSSFRAIIAKMDSSFRGYLFAVETTGQVVFILRNTSTTNGIIVRTASSPIAINTWYNITVTYNGTSSPNGVNFYINSEIISNSVAQDNLSSTVLNSQAGAIGARIGPNDGYLLGNIASTQIYNRALSSTEVSQNFNALRGRYGI